MQLIPLDANIDQINYGFGDKKSALINSQDRTLSHEIYPITRLVNQKIYIMLRATG
jgi:hypothetical protein